MTRLSAVLPLGGAATLSATTALWADSWIQIEAQPTLTQATEAAQSYAVQMPNVAGFDLPGRWHAIAIGPFATPEEADAQRRQLLAAGLIPRDSYLTEGERFGQPFWPVGASIATLAPATPAAPADTAEAAPDVVEQVEVPTQPLDESPAEARASERALDRPAREALQIALRYAGVYNSGIDGAFGPGTRAAMAAWQAQQGYEATGVLTTRQRGEVLAAYQDDVDSLGLAPVTDDVAGIAITLPTGLIAAAPDYAPPFAKYGAKDGSGVQVMLISQTGDEATLGGLYEIMQTLEIVPLEGPRERSAREFTLTGANATTTSHTEARLVDGTVKGWTLIWPAGDERRRALALDAMRASFAPMDGAVLPDAFGDEAQDIDLLAGLDIRRPDRTGTGFYVTPQGAVLTEAALVAQCGKITLDGSVEADVTATRDGLALLTPREALAPLAVARFDSRLPRLQADVAVAGFPYEGRLGLPTLNYGKLAETVGLAGETDLLRLELAALAGEAGGPLLSSEGAVIGMLTEVDTGARALPDGVAFAYDMEKLAGFLSGAGVTVAAAETQPEALSDAELVETGRDLATLVSCWN